MLDDVCATLHAQSDGADEKFLEVVTLLWIVSRVS